MADNEQKALQLMAEAEKKMTTSKGFFGSLFGYISITYLSLFVYCVLHFVSLEKEKHFLLTT